MGLTLSPEFSEIFPTEKPVIDKLVKGVPSMAIMSNLAAVNSMIEAKYKQQEILRIFLRRQPYAIFNNIITRLNAYHLRVSPTKWLLFTKLNICQFMIWVCKNGNTDNRDSTPEKELAIFKAYLLIVEKFHQEQMKINIDKTTDYSFNNLSWPIFSSQFEFNFEPSLEIQLVRSYAFLDELFNNKLEEHIKQFGKGINVRTEKYIAILYEIITTRKIQNFAGIEIPQCFILIEEDQSNILDHLSIDFNEIRNETDYDLNFLAIKKYPLVKVKEGMFIVLNWTYLKLKLYDGFIFDFYHNSGIKAKFKTFPDYKIFLGTNVSEKRIFKPLMETIYNKKHHIVHFDDQNDGTPDLYLRVNKRIYLFEFKDTLVASKVTVSESFEAVKKEVFKKLVKNQKGKARGLGQLANQIKFLESDCYGFDDIKNIEKKRIEIYPILVYTDNFYSMPGINKYLIDEFNKLVPSHCFKLVEKPVLINLSYLARNINWLSNARMDKLIREYFRKLKTSEKKTKKGLDIDYWINSNKSFDMVSPSSGLTTGKNNFSRLIDLIGIDLKRMAAYNTV